jgi:phosphopantetheinyl transferase
MTRFMWIEDTLHIPDSAPGRVIIWIFRRNGAVANRMLACVRPTRADLADAALARQEAGAPRLQRRLLLRALAARVLDRHVDDIEVARSRGGGLLLPGCALHASVSGSGAYAAIALGAQPVGVDIEVLEAGAQAEGMRQWTALEACLKRSGTGFGIGAPQTDFSMDHGEWLCTRAFVAAAVTLAPDAATRSHAGTGNFKANSHRRHAVPGRF